MKSEPEHPKDTGSTMVEQIVEALHPHGLTYVHIEPERSIAKIWDLWTNYNEAMQPTTAAEHVYFAAYQKYINGDHELAVEHYLMAAKEGNTVAMCILGGVCEDERNYKKAVEYYLMAIKKGNTEAMWRLGYIYESCVYGSCVNGIERNYEKAVEYYLMAVNKGSTAAMRRLAMYYVVREDNYELAAKYYLMSLKHGSKLCEMSLHKKLSNRLLLKVVKLLLEQTQKLESELEISKSYHFDAMDAHYMYAPGGDGCKQAKEDFLSRLNE